MGRLLLMLAAPLLLTSCLLTPGRFTSTLDINADRGFTFTYLGEAVLDDSATQLRSLESSDEGGEKPVAPATPKAETQEQLLQRQAAAAALSREVGYRSVEYIGGNKFRVDYSFTGRLDRSFVFPPFNPEGASLIPWLAIEVRKDGTARMQAPGFGDQPSEIPVPVPTPPDALKDRAGTFTFTTDVQLVMQNNEAGLAPGLGTRVVWQITPTTKGTPTAVVRFAN